MFVTFGALPTWVHTETIGAIGYSGATTLRTNSSSTGLSRPFGELTRAARPFPCSATDAKSYRRLQYLASKRLFGRGEPSRNSTRLPLATPREHCVLNLHGRKHVDGQLQSAGGNGQRRTSQFFRDPQ
jgi:hypothetical protein